MSKLVWFVQQGPQSEYLEGILKFLMPEYARIFGDELMHNEECLVYNDPLANCPMLIINTTPVRIRLAQQSLNYWAQTIFQFSHELCHYALRQGKTNKDLTLLWFEEIVGEAMSLYALYWSSRHWESCSLSSMNPSFSHSLSDYLNDILGQKCSEGLQSCTTIEALKGYNAGNNREEHRNERNSLFYEIIRDPVLCSCFCDYQRYLNGDGVTIDFERWKRNDANPLVPFLQGLQPC